jgi:UDP-glucose 4-epimerase
MNKKVLITGGAGFIGSAVIRELNGRGYAVSILDNLSSGRRDHAPVPDENFHTADILDPAAVARVVAAVQPAWIIHLAAIHFIPQCNAQPYEASNINLHGTLHVLDAARGVQSVEKVFFASTAAVYADSPEPVNESSPIGPMDIYGITKSIGERLVREFNLATGVPCVIGRLFNAYGPRETNPHLIPEILRQIEEGRRDLSLGNIATRRDYIHTSDMARAIALLMERNAPGVEVYNIGTGSSLTASDVVQSCERAANCAFQITVASDRVRKIDRALLQADISQLRAATGWEPKVNFEEGISALVRNEP